MRGPEQQPANEDETRRLFPPQEAAFSATTPGVDSSCGVTLDGTCARVCVRVCVRVEKVRDRHIGIDCLSIFAPQCCFTPGCRGSAQR